MLRFAKCKKFSFDALAKEASNLIDSIDRLIEVRNQPIEWHVLNLATESKRIE